jgi:hypothetical protein
MQYKTAKGTLVSEIKKISKYTVGAFSEDGTKLVTAKSKPKLMAKLIEVESEPAAKPVAKPSKPASKTSIKTDVINLILQDKEDDEIVATIKAHYTTSKFNFAHISWYRSTLFRDNLITAKHAPRRTRSYKDWKASQEK